MKNISRIAIIGGGPSALFMFKRFVDTGNKNVSIQIFEKNNQVGAGMPYSTDGANDEHVTNVSSNEIPLLVTTIVDWIKTVHKDTLDKYHIDKNDFNEYKVLPRLLFGQYLSHQFKLLQAQASAAGMQFNVNYNSEVTDIIDVQDQQLVTVEVNGTERYNFDAIIICSGHNWPKANEGKIKGFFDSPYPPSKLAFECNTPVAIKGSSLTAIDALRTLSRYNGDYTKDENGILTYHLKDTSTGFKLIMHSRNGLLPAVRFHLEDPHLSKNETLTPDEIQQHREQNDGFLSLDYVFDRDFKAAFKLKRPEFYEKIKLLSIEQFVDSMMQLRESIDPFDLLKMEYDEAAQSIEQRRSVYWKEMLAILSFAMNYPAKYLSAEDMMRLQKTLMPLISVVIAFVPQSSVEEMLALHKAGLLELITVDDDSYVEPVNTGGAIYHYIDENKKQQTIYYNTYVDCVGQPHLNYEDFPYEGLINKHTITPARLKFRNADTGLAAMNSGNNKVETDGKGNYYLNVPGVVINDNFQTVDEYGAYNERVYIMAVPYIGGYNPDYSGLDFCEAASKKIIESIIKDEPAISN
ncbi:FAD/NAD(P)-binding protein [Mucilaginibacter litoreus]|uniref:FAD/NAD(P)-binding protein n=1 Tax=Mucilaginibacter litoreus TaxID=1048221 RepID=A0ABW3ARJ6_9SPHI